MRLFFLVCMVQVCLFPVQGFALSDELHKQYSEQSYEFTESELRLSNAWRMITSILPEDKRKALIDSQRTWLREGRENHANYFMEHQALAGAEAYAKATNARAVMLERYLQQTLNPKAPVTITGLVTHGKDEAGASWLLLDEYKNGYTIAYPWMAEEQLNAALTLAEDLEEEVELNGFLSDINFFDSDRPVTVTKSRGEKAYQSQDSGTFPHNQPDGANAPTPIVQPPSPPQPEEVFLDMPDIDTEPSL